MRLTEEQEREFRKRQGVDLLGDYQGVIFGLGVRFSDDEVVALRKYFDRFEQKLKGAYKVEKGGVELIISVTTPSAPNTSAAIERYLCHGPAELGIGVGYAGGLQDDVEIGDIVIPVCAERGEGTSYHYLPARHFPPHRRGNSIFPAIPSRRLQASLVENAEKEKLRSHSGKIYTTDSFYMELEGFMEELNKSDFLGIDMETSALFTIADYHDKEAAAILVVSDKPYPKSDHNLVYWDGRDFVFGKSGTSSQMFLKAIEVATETLLEFV